MEPDDIDSSDARNAQSDARDFENAVSENPASRRFFLVSDEG